MAIRNDGSVVSHVSSFIERFVFFPNESTYHLLGTWVIATYLSNHFEYSGYVFAFSAEPQSGKSRLLEVLDLIVSNSSGVLVAPTEAVLFRTAENTTQLLDEVDSWTNREALQSVLNAGFRRGSTVPRMKESGPGYALERFPVYGPRALAGIGLRVLTQTTRDRTFMLEMVRQKPDDRRERFRSRIIGPEAEALRADITRWAKVNETAVARCYDGAFPYLEHLRDRTIDVSQPLAAVLEVAYQGNPAFETAQRELIDAVAFARRDQEAPTDGHLILAELARLTQTENPLVGNATELAERCTGLPVKPSEYAVSGVLQRYGYKTKSIRQDGGDPRYRYELEYAKLADIVDRYAGRAAAQQEPTEAIET